MWRTVYGLSKHVTADGAHVCWNPVNDDDAAIVADGVRHKPRLTITRTTGNSALHSTLLWIGVIHLGGFGSYTVIITKTGCAVVHTMCSGLPARVVPPTRQQAPRRCVA